MNPREIQKVCIESSINYYNYLSRNKKSRDLIDIKSVKKRENDVYILKLSKKIYDPDFVYLEIAGQECDKSKYELLSYDKDNNNLLIRASEQLGKIITNIELRHIKIISDLKYLVKRVGKWYQQNGHMVSFDRNLPCIIPKKIDERASEEQIKAIKTIFKSKVSYIWGAPGTGKTRFVLSNAILEYIKSDIRIMIAAPTNNALEQSLRGVLAVLDEKNITRKKVLRLGIPTLSFAKDFPECIEVSGAEKKLIDLEKRKNICVFKLNQKHKYAIKELEELKEENEYIESEIIGFERKIEENRLEIITIGEAFEKKEKKYKSKFFITKRKRDILRGDLEILMHSIDIKKDKESQFIKEKDKLKSRQEEINKKCNDLQIKINNLKKVIGDVKADAINKELDDPKESIDDLKVRLEKINKDIEIIRQSAIKERLKEVRVIAVTMDGFINKIEFKQRKSFISNNPLGIEHVFIDEAGYCNLIKAGTVFAFNCPITLLGDHMQLPPVCEMNDDLITKHENKNVCLWADSAISVENLFYTSMEGLYESYIKKQRINFEQIKKSELTETYRFGPELSEILNKNIYKNGFHSAKNCTKSNIELLSISKVRGEKKRENPAEAEAIKNYLKASEITDYAILSPYKNQVQLISKLIPKAHEEQRVMTVHASQGREWEVVIFSIVDTYDKFFVANKYGLKLMNTAISRTKKTLVIVCDAEFWENASGELISELVKVAKKREYGFRT